MDPQRTVTRPINRTRGHGNPTLTATTLLRYITFLQTIIYKIIIFLGISIRNGFFLVLFLYVAALEFFHLHNVSYSSITIPFIYFIYIYIYGLYSMTIDDANQIVIGFFARRLILHRPRTSHWFYASVRE